MTKQQSNLIAYFRRCRADAISRYKSIRFVDMRQNARRNALHYSRLLRKYGGAS